MHSGVIAAYSGLKAQMEALDTLANNLANVNTAGFKEQVSFFRTLNLARDSSGVAPLESAINNAVTSGSALNVNPGTLLETHRDLDIAIEGEGFLTVETPQGLRYTRNGNLIRNAESVLCTADGFPVLGESGRIVLSPGKVNITQDGQIQVDGNNMARLKVVSFEHSSSLTCEGHSLFAAAQGADNPGPASGAAIRQGYQEQSNVNPVMSTVRMVEILRHFEAIQKSVNLMINDLDAKAIEKLGR